MLDDGAFDAKPVLNTITSKEYIPIIKRGLTSPRGFGARIRDRIKTKRKESFKTRVILRLIVYCLKIIVRWIYE
jgi:hypothetical protein